MSEAESREERRLRIIAEMAVERLKPRLIKGHDLAPKGVNDFYERLWQQEDKTLLKAEERLRGGILRRLLRKWGLVR